MAPPRARAGHRSLAVAALGGALGGGRPALLRPLLPAAPPAAVPDQRRRARPACASASSRARSRSRSPPRRDSPSSASSPGRGATSRSTNGVSQYLERHLRKADSRLRVGPRARDLLGVGCAAGHPVPVDGFVNGNWGGRPPGDRRSDVPTPGARQMLMERPPVPPTAVHPRHDPGRVPRLAVPPDEFDPRAPAVRRPRLPVRPQDRRDRGLRAPRPRAGHGARRRRTARAR